MIADINKGRIFASTQFILLAIIFILSYLLREEPLNVIKIISYYLLGSGLILSIWAFCSFNQKITPNPHPLEKAVLRTNRFYRHVRHPLYLSDLIIIIGWCLYFYSIISIFFPVVAFIFLTFKMDFEEKLLDKKFPEYKDYKKSSYRLFPSIY